MTYPALSMIIDGERVAGGGRRTHSVRNPATGETLAELPLADAADLDRALEVRSAVSVSGAYRHRTSAPRCCRARRG